MARDDHNKLIYIILKVLSEYQKLNKKFDPDEISAETLKIEECYRAELMEELISEGYITGCKVKNYVCGKQITGIENTKITSKGHYYLTENSVMKKIGNILKEVKDWVSFSM